MYSVCDNSSSSNSENKIFIKRFMDSIFAAAIVSIVIAITIELWDLNYRITIIIVSVNAFYLLPTEYLLQLMISGLPNIYFCWSYDTKIYFMIIVLIYLTLDTFESNKYQCIIHLFYLYLPNYLGISLFKCLASP